MLMNASDNVPAGAFKELSDGGSAPLASLAETNDAYAVALLLVIVFSTEML